MCPFNWELLNRTLSPVLAASRRAIPLKLLNWRTCVRRPAASVPVFPCTYRSLSPQSPSRPLLTPRRTVLCLSPRNKQLLQPFAQILNLLPPSLTTPAMVPLRKQWLRAINRMEFPHRVRQPLSYATELTLRRPAGLLSNNRLGVRTSIRVKLMCPCRLLDSLFIPPATLLKFNSPRTDPTRILAR